MVIVAAGVVGVVGVVDVVVVFADADAAVLPGALLVTWAPEHPPRTHAIKINPARRDCVAT
jgi:hypothetical protein